MFGYLLFRIVSLKIIEQNCIFAIIDGPAVKHGSGANI